VGRCSVAPWEATESPGGPLGGHWEATHMTVAVRSSVVPWEATEGPRWSLGRPPGGGGAVPRTSTNEQDVHNLHIDP